MEALVKQRGMTLIEVMVAAAILAIVMVAVIVVASQTQRSTVTLSKKTQAQWVANNIDAEIRAGLHGKISQTGSLQGSTTLGQQVWYWMAKAQAIQEHVIQVQITVQDHQNGRPLVTTTTAIWEPS